jgi:hypothetical protein
MVADADHAYFFSGNAPTVWSVPLMGGTPISVGTDNGPYGADYPLAVDDTSLYWWAQVAGGQASLMRRTPK